MNGKLRSDKQIGKKLYNAEVAPPAFIWDNIEKELDTKQKKFPLWLKLSGVAAAITVAFIAGWMLNTQLNQEQLTATVTENIKIEEVKPTETPKANTALIDTKQETVTTQPRNIVSVKKENKNIKPIRKQATAIQPVKRVNENWVAMVVKEFKLLKTSFEHEGLHLQHSNNTIAPNNSIGLLSDQDKAIIKMNLAQADIEKDRFKPYLQLGARFGASNKLSEGTPAGRDYAQLTPTNNGTPTPVSSMMNNTDLKVSSSKGLAVSYQISKRLSIESGMYYSNLSQGREGVNYNNSINSILNDSPQFVDKNPQPLRTKKAAWSAQGAWGVVNVSEVPQASTFYASNEGTIENNQSYYSNTTLDQQAEYIEVPMLVKYKMIDRAVDVNLLGGISANFLINNSVYIKTDDGRKNVGETEGLTNITYSSTVGVGVSYNVLSSLSLSVEPKLKYFLNSITGSKTTQRRPVVMGIYAGISYQF